MSYTGLLRMGNKLVGNEYNWNKYYDSNSIIFQVNLGLFELEKQNKLLLEVYFHVCKAKARHQTYSMKIILNGIQ